MCDRLFFLVAKLVDKSSVPDPWHGVDPDLDPDPAIFVINLQNANKKLIFYLFSAYHFSKIKSPKKSQNSRNKGFSYYFCLLIEGPGAGSGSIPLTNGSGSGRPKNMWIRTYFLVGGMMDLIGCRSWTVSCTRTWLSFLSRTGENPPLTVFFPRYFSRILLCQHQQQYSGSATFDTGPQIRTTGLRISAGIFKQFIGARNRVGIGLSFWPGRLHSLAELVPWNRFLGSLKV